MSPSPSGLPPESRQQFVREAIDTGVEDIGIVCVERKDKVGGACIALLFRDFDRTVHIAALHGRSQLDFGDLDIVERDVEAHAYLD
jgi:hypothetical protein